MGPEREKPSQEKPEPMIRPKLIKLIRVENLPTNQGAYTPLDVTSDLGYWALDILGWGRSLPNPKETASSS